MNASAPKIVVGVDGSPSGTVAVGWAAAEARRRGLPIELVLAYQASWVGLSPEAFVVPAPSASPMPHTLEEARAHVLAVWPEAEVSMLPLPESPAHALVSASAEAALVVVGAHGRSVMGRLLLGSVSQHVATHARCPAVVVRGAQERPTLPVTAGIDDSATAAAALDFACVEASSRGVPLDVVHAWQRPPAVGYGAWLPPTDFGPAVRAGAEAFMAGVVERLHVAHPDLEVRPEVVEGSPSVAILERSEVSQLLVVGAHGRGAFPGMWFGSVASAAIHGSACPVAVFPAVHAPAAPPT
jgi:nucleotide-binding universal stress UspA family protein